MTKVIEKLCEDLEKCGEDEEKRREVIKKYEKLGLKIIDDGYKLEVYDKKTNKYYLIHIHEERALAGDIAYGYEEIKKEYAKKLLDHYNELSK